jgi:RHS repeat-associated protein
LRSVTLPGGRVIDYVIDALNRRVGKKVNGTVVTGWIYSDNLRVIAETDGTGAVTKRFVYGYHRNVPDYMIWQGSAYRIVADHLGSPRYVLESTAGTVAQVLTYDEFGNVQNDSRPGFQPFGFGGGLYDPDTRLVRFGNRDYDPQTGRWTAKDPLLFDGGDVNVYAYVLDDPINLSDRAGLSSLIFTPSNDSVTVVNGAGQAVGTFPAANNAQSSSRGPWPEGTYRYAYHVDHPDDSVDSPFGSYGNFVFKVPGCTGCGVHSGRANKRDRRGRSGVHFATNGCVRTTDPATQFLSQLIAAGDPLSGLTVSDQPIPTNIPPIDSSLEGGPVVYPPDHP